MRLLLSLLGGTRPLTWVLLLSKVSGVSGQWSSDGVLIKHEFIDVRRNPLLW